MSTNHRPIDARVAVVTGASSGIGAATARALSDDGYRVALLARRIERTTAFAEELGNGSIAVEADVTDRESLVASAELIQTELGPADVLVNNAGVMLLGPFAADRRADYRQMIEVNLLGAITATEVFLPQLRHTAEERRADVVNISSVPGRTAEALRPEHLPDVRVTLIEPGVVATELPDHTTHTETREAVGSLYDHADVTADDVAEIIAAFAAGRPRRLAINEILLRPAGQA